MNQTFFNEPPHLSGRRMTDSRSAAPSACRTAGRCWPVTRGRQSRVEGLSVNTNPNKPDQRDGSAGRTEHRLQRADWRINLHQFTPGGTYVFPWHDIGLAGNFNSQSGIVITLAAHGGADGRGQQHGERGTARLIPAAASYSSPISASSRTRASATNSLDLSVDFSNITNANTAWMRGHWAAPSGGWRTALLTAR